MNVEAGELKKKEGSRYKENVTLTAAEKLGALTETGMHVGFVT